MYSTIIDAGIAHYKAGIYVWDDNSDIVMYYNIIHVKWVTIYIVCQLIYLDQCY